ncbi:hypothetical protein R4Z10_05490 [Niallia sp. XMNu-256]|uniref:hypothetical protein n=1 Tax=Niallia sp. XMNu-256 TaxID=3082444 RepID=UPI0030D1791B
MRSYLILGMSLLFLIQYFVGEQWLQYVVVVFALLAFLGSITKADPFPRIIGLLMMTFGFVIELSKGTGMKGISEGIFLILPLLCLLTLVPLLSIPLKLGGHFESISILLRKFLNQPKKLYAGITGILFVLGPILNLGSVRIIHDFLEELKLPSAMSARSYVVGFSTAMLWSPYFASVTLVLHYQNVAYSDYFFYGIGLSILSLILGNVLFAFWAKKNTLNVEVTESSIPFTNNHRRNLYKLILFVILLISACLAIEKVTQWSMVVIVCLLSIMVPLLMGAFAQDWKELLPPLIDFKDHTVPLMNNEIMLFMSAGMLAYALKGTSIMNGVSSFLTVLSRQSFILFAIAIVLIVFCITFIGIHQIAAIGVLAMQLDPSELGISNLALALTLLLTWTTTTALSPFSGLNLMVSRFSSISGNKLGLRINGPHLLAVVFIGIALIAFIK